MIPYRIASRAQSRDQIFVFTREKERQWTAVTYVPDRSFQNDATAAGTADAVDTIPKESKG